MRILFRPTTEADYLSDTLFHGLRCLLGADVVDSPKLLRAYKGEDPPAYGRGFTAWNNLEDIQVDRSEIEAKQRDGHFDFVLHFDEPFLSGEGVILVDGRDRRSYPSARFARELTDASALPISFSFPAEKVRGLGGARGDLSSYNPVHNHYLFEREEDYYEHYRTFRYAKTMKKAGWDCMRHYEIMAMGTIPLFENIEQCPEHTCTSLPKDMLIQATKISQGDRERFYDEFAGEMMDHFLSHCTTVAEAARFLERI